MFSLGCTSDKIWNIKQLIEYLAANQNKKIEIVTNPEAVCLNTLGLYTYLDAFNFDQVKIYTYNPFESHPRYNIIFIDNFWLKKKESIDSRLHDWNLSKKFLCFYHRPTAARLGIGAHVLNQYKNNCHLHFSANLDQDNLLQFELDKLLEYDIKSVETVGKLIKSLPLLLGSPERYTWNQGYYFDDPLTDLYKDILIDVVVESHVKGKTFFPTEKTTRPMWLKKPFIIFASKNYLLYLRQMGFRTFSDFWSEDYDGYEGPERFIRIINLLDELNKKSHVELEKMYWDMAYTLQHNFDLLNNQSYQTKLTYID